VEPWGTEGGGGLRGRKTAPTPKPGEIAMLKGFVYGGPGRPVYLIPGTFRKKRGGSTKSQQGTARGSAIPRKKEGNFKSRVNSSSGEEASTTMQLHE